MRRRLRVWIGCLAAAALLAACSSGPSVPPGSVTGVSQGAAPAAGAGAADRAPDLAALRAAAALERCPATAAAAVPAGARGLPPVEVACLGGGAPVRMGALRGPAIVNFWSTTCTICTDEMPLLQQAHARWGDAVTVLGVDTQDDTAAAYDLLHDAGVTYPSVSDPRGLVLAHLPRPLKGLPQTLFIAADGHVAHIQSGAVPSLSALRALVQTHLGVTLPA